MTTILKDKVALITGSARGIGRAIALRFASLGADIIVNYNSNKKAAEEAVKEIEGYGVKAFAIKADVSKLAEINQMFEFALSNFGRIDIVVVNAGLELVDVPVTEFNEMQFDSLFNTNTKGAFFTMQAAAKNIAANGRIICIGSSTTGFPNPGYAIHGGSKMAPLYLVEVMAKELAKKAVTVNAILPTATEGAGIYTVVEADAPIKKMISEFNPTGRMGIPEDVANVAEFFASELSSFVSGQHLLVSGGALV